MKRFIDYLIEPYSIYLNENILEMGKTRGLVLAILLLFLVLQSFTIDVLPDEQAIKSINNNPNLALILAPGKAFCYDVTVWKDLRKKANQEQLKYISNHYIQAVKRSIIKGTPAAITLTLGLIDQEEQLVIAGDSILVCNQFSFYYKLLEVLSVHQQIKVNNYSMWLTLVETAPLQIDYRVRVLDYIVRFSLWKFDTC